MSGAHALGRTNLFDASTESETANTAAPAGAAQCLPRTEARTMAAITATYAPIGPT
jgi:hypothetical protein